MAKKIAWSVYHPVRGVVMLINQSDAYKEADKRNHGLPESAARYRAMPAEEAYSERAWRAQNS
jgi:hypothetical protein